VVGLVLLVLGISCTVIPVPLPLSDAQAGGDGWRPTEIKDGAAADRRVRDAALPDFRVVPPGSDASLSSGDGGVGERHPGDGSAGETHPADGSAGEGGSREGGSADGGTSDAGSELHDGLPH
jgi:hypothetical protein